VDEASTTSFLAVYDAYNYGKVKVKCAILLLGIGGVLISLSNAMNP